MGSIWLRQHFFFVSTFYSSGLNGISLASFLFFRRCYCYFSGSTRGCAFPTNGLIAAIRYCCTLFCFRYGRNFVLSSSNLFRVRLLESESDFKKQNKTKKVELVGGFHESVLYCSTSCKYARGKYSIQHQILCVNVGGCLVFGYISWVLLITSMYYG